MKRPPIRVILLLVVLAASIGWLVVSGGESRENSGLSTATQREFSRLSPPDTARGHVAPADRSADQEAAAHGAQPAAQAPDYLARLRASADYWQFAESVIGAARQGDAAAQYYLSQALFHCETLYDWYFIEHLPGGANRTRTLDEAQQLTATRKVLTADDVRDLQGKCQRLRNNSRPPFGTAREWLDLALANSYPLAQVQASLERAMQGYQQPTDAATRAVRDDARRLALEALRTGDPQVMARMGDVAANLAGGNSAESRKLQWVWPLAACLRKAGCDALTDWMHLYCNIDGQCQPFETAVDVIRRQAGNDYDEIERRARELNEKIDAGTLTEGDI